jgi:cell division septum initiation protein DivIVA
MDEMKQIQRENGRLKMQLDLLKRKLYQVCMSHDYLTGKFRGLGLPMTTSDTTMVQTTARIMKATSTEEVETIYNEAQKSLWETKFGSPTPKQKQDPVQKVFFFGTPGEGLDLTHDSIRGAIEKMISELDKHIKGLENKENDFSIDDSDEPEDPMDKTDDLKPPF